MKVEDLTGRKFNSWTVTSRAENTKDGSSRWNVICDCGNTSIVLGKDLRHNYSKKCRTCSNQVKGIKHGLYKTKEYNKSKRLKHLYKLDINRYNEISNYQDNVCEICGSKEIERSLSVDHDHSCCAYNRSCGKCIRGLICNSCNKMLGGAKDNTRILENAIEYLKKYNGEINV